MVSKEATTGIAIQKMRNNVLIVLDSSYTAHTRRRKRNDVALLPMILAAREVCQTGVQ